MDNQSMGNAKKWAIGCLVILAVPVFIGLLIGESDASHNHDQLKDREYKDNSANIYDSAAVALAKSRADSLSRVRQSVWDNAIDRLESLRSETDEFNNVTFYQDPRTPQYTNVNSIYPYIGRRDSRFWLRIRLQYASDDWLFIDRAILLVDGEKYYLDGEWKRDNNSEIWEWLDVQASPDDLNMLRKMAVSTSCKVRYEGSKYHNDRDITQREKDIIDNIISIYDDLNALD